MNRTHPRTLGAVAAIALLAACGGTTTEQVQVTTDPSTYIVEYLPGMMDATIGKSAFKLRVRKRADYLPATGLSMTLVPKMTMPTQVHGSPHTTVVESATPGTYDAAVYWLMMSGANMGYWELQVKIGAETAIFYPAVGMSMSPETINAKMWGAADSAVNPAMPTRYLLFRDGPVSAASPVFKLFLSHSEEMMMNFKPAAPGETMALPTGAIAAMSVRASADAAFTAPVELTAGTPAGHWSGDLSSFGLAEGAASTVYVRLTVNGEVKTVDGLPLTTIPKRNDTAQFKIVPAP